ncbi:MAG: hypothetical protein JW850_01580 [Thermoflexales bacterium]|nr:hypothetical protein [Thermoflexales bacterium]
MSDTLLYLVLGALVGAALTLVVLGATLWRQSPAQDPAPASPASLPEGAPDNAIRVLPDYDGKWMVQLGGKSYYSLDQVSDPLATQRLSRMLEALSTFAGRPPQAAPEPLPAAEPALPSEMEPSPPAEVLPPLPETELELAPPTIPVPPLTASAAPVPPPELNFEALVKPLPAPPPQEPATSPRLRWGWGKKAAEPPPPPILGIAEQIDQVLQRLLENRPDVPAGGIHIGAADDGSLRIEVAGRVYPGVDSVPDPGVRELLKAAVKEWEAQV